MYELKIKSKEKEEILRAVKSLNYIGALWDIDIYLQDLEKYGRKDVNTDKKRELVRTIRQDVLELMSRNNVDFDSEYP